MLPNLPGYSFRNHRKTDYRRPQTFQVTAGLMGTKAPRPEDMEKTITERTLNITTTAPPTQPSETFPDYVPAHVAYEHLVLRFYAYFRENISESAEETYRVRYVKIMVYLEDDTVMIEENHVRNSGIAQGVLLRRMPVLNPLYQDQGVTYTNLDFKVGINIEIFGIVYRIYACDQFTEQYLQSEGREIGEFETPPDDLYTIKRTLTERPIRVSHVQVDKTNLKRFLEFDQKVLRFYTIWDDRKSLFGERRKFVLNYFLVDGRIEIRQVLPQNSGRDPVSNFLRKTILTNPRTGQPYSDADLMIGETVNAFNRNFFIYDADKFTREWLDAKYGIHDWTPINVEEKAKYSGIKHDVPPYNGWGDEEDSLGYCNSLHPKPPRKDIKKLIEKDGQLLRFAAHFKNPQFQDKNRKFVISYYLADDTVGIFEAPQRNSGFGEGKFLQRTRIKNPETGKYYTAQDFELGKEVTINKYTFILEEADEFALNYMEAGAEEFPQSDLFGIVTTMKQTQSLNLQDLRNQFEMKDPELNGYVPEKDAREVLQKAGLNEHQVVTILRRWTENKQFDYFGFSTALN